MIEKNSNIILATERYLISQNESIEFSCFISSYNESEFIEKTLSEIIQAFKELRVNYEILIIDDCSSDNSYEVIKKLIIKYHDVNIMIVIKSLNIGLSKNYFEAASICRGKYFKLFCGDNTELSSQIVKICQLRESADIVIPYYRNVIGKNKFRILVSNFYTKILNFITGLHIPYYNGLQVHLRKNIVNIQNLSDGFSFQAEILCYLLLTCNASYVTVEIDAVENKPSNALNFKNLFSVVTLFFKLILNKIFRINYF